MYHVVKINIQEYSWLGLFLCCSPLKMAGYLVISQYSGNMELGSQECSGGTWGMPLTSLTTVAQGRVYGKGLNRAKFGLIH